MNAATSRRFSMTKLSDRINVIQAFKDVDHTMALSEVLFFLAAVRYPESTLNQVAEAAGIPRASGSRYLMHLSTGTPHKGIVGKGWLHGEENPYNRKEKIITVTEKGYEFLANLL